MAESNLLFVGPQVKAIWFRKFDVLAWCLSCCGQSLAGLEQLNPPGDGLGVANGGFRPGDTARAGYRGSFSEFERDGFGQLGRLPAAGRKVGQVQEGQGIGLRETEIVDRADIGRTSVRSGF